ncbi:unnamed protein product [Adineta steineri]|uniref:Exostosin GT47 domain-containing protein n=1 Tax=Adineta steineri TaxID=433720 RepID=A0A814HPY8_9BILA|nr:unnamed protein product [Adineta steineri]
MAISMVKFNNILTGKYYVLFYVIVLLCIVYILLQFYRTTLLPKFKTLLSNRVTKNNTTYYYYHSSSYNTTNLEPNVSLYYHHATSDRNSSYPFISGDTFRAFSDYVYDETRNDNLSAVKYGDIVFVKTDMLPSFFNSSFNSIQEPFVLISHNSDYSAPGRYVKYLRNPKILHCGDTFRAFSDYIYDETRNDNLSSVKYGEIVFVKTDLLPSFFNSSFNSIREPFVLISHNSDYSAPGRYVKYLRNPKILHWYVSNLNQTNLQKISPIPIGLANTRWPQGNLDTITFAFKNHRKPWSHRTTFLYVNFAVGTNIVKRTKALSKASPIKNVQIMKEKITFETYLEQTGNAKFVLSPPGNGLDCHRTWEALLMGAVPIVLRSELDPLFIKTRSIIIDDWSKLSYKFLSSFKFSSDDNYVPDVLYAHYWRETLFKYRKKVD